MSKKKRIQSGSKIMLPHCAEFCEDIFIVTRVRPHLDTYVIDAFCDGQEEIQISIGIDDVEAL